MKKEFLPWFVLISLSIIVFLITITQLLGFEPNVSSTIVKYFIYAIGVEFAYKITDENKEDGPVYLIKFLAIISGMIVVVYILCWVTGKILGLDLETRGMAAYMALVVGLMFGFKFMKLFKNKLFF